MLHILCSQILPAQVPVFSPNMMQNNFLLIKDHIGLFAIARNMYDCMFLSCHVRVSE